MSGPRLRGGILAGEVALCVVSLAAAGLLLRSAQELDRVDMGFDGAGVTRFTLVPPVARYPDRADLVQLISAVEGEIGQVPGVENVGSVFGAPLTTDRLGVRVSLDGAPDAETVVVYRPATAGYFATMGVPTTKGRGLRSQALLEGPPEAVLNELAASVLFGDDGDPLGRSVTVNSLFGEGSMRVVGVVGDVRRNITAEPTPAIYPLYSSIEPAWRGLVVHAKVQPGFGDAVRELRSAVARVDPDLIAALPETVAEARNRETLRTQVFGGLLSGFALIAVLLAGLGLYGVVGHLVSQRTSEIGIRIALGAGRRRVAALVVTQGIGSCLAGLIVGLAVVAFGGRVLEALLFGVTPTDPSVLGGVAAVILGVACLAIWMPVRAAVRVDPVVALRAE